jgi:hypothetical protein
METGSVVSRSEAPSNIFGVSMTGCFEAAGSQSNMELF